MKWLNDSFNATYSDVTSREGAAGCGRRSQPLADVAKRSGFVLFLVALLVPPAIAGGLGTHFVARHPVWAVGIAVAYEAVAAVGGYFALIARDLLERWRPLIVNRLDFILRRQGPRFERQYIQYILAGLQSTDQKGLVSVGNFTPALDAVFIDVSLVPRPPQDVPPGVLPEPAGDRPGRRSLSEFLDRLKPVRLVVLGAQGSGKTTLLRYAARQACLSPPARKDRRDCARHLPVLLYLRDHDAVIAQDEAVPLTMLLRGTLKTVFADEPPGWLEQKLKDGQCSVLLDGLDEIPAPENRAKAARWIERQIQAYPGNHFVISSRPRSYQFARIEGAEIVQVCGFTADQVKRFIHAWYREIERHADSTEGGAAATARAQQNADARAALNAEALSRLLEQAPAIYDLAVSPLLLTMIANFHNYRGTLPRTRANLYSEICDVVLWRRQEAKGLQQPLTGLRKKALLSELAYAMMRGGVTGFGRDDAVAAIKPALRRASAGITPVDFLDQSGSDGLLIERDPGQYAFAHKTFQEYLASVSIREKNLVHVLADAVNDDWWASVTVFYAAQSDADPIIRACLDADTSRALALASECAEQDSDLDPDLRTRLHAVTVSSADFDDPTERRRLAGVLMSRHLRQRTSVDSGVQICARPITSEIYRLFLADTQVSPPDADPEVLKTPGVVTTGVRPRDVDAFLAWANAVIDGQPTCRLPLAAEIDELVEKQRIPPLPSGDLPDIWVNPVPQGQRPEIRRLSPRASTTIGADQGTLRRAVAHDMANVANSIPMLCGLLLQRAQILAKLRTRRLADQRLQADLARSLAFALDLALDLDFGRTSIPDCDIDPDSVVGSRASDLDLALDRAYARARDLTRNLEIARVARAADLTHALDLDLDLTRARDLARDPSLDLGVDVALALSRALDRVRALDLAHAHDLGLKGALDSARALDRALNRVRALVLVYVLAHARAHARDLSGALDLALTLHSDLDIFAPCPLALPPYIPITVVDLDAAQNHDSRKPASGQPGQMGIDTVARLIMGRAFTDSISRALADSSGPYSFIGKFSAEFATAVQADKGAWLGDPDGLPKLLQYADDLLGYTLDKANKNSRSPSWAASAASHLMEIATPVFDRSERPTEEKSTAIRITALCLAGEADRMGDTDIGSKFRQMAAGITWLEQRYTGKVPATEAVLLAVE
jgi:hypothetical protein